MVEKSNAYRLLDSKLCKYFKKQSDKWDPNKHWRWPSICYTLAHKCAYLDCEHYLTGCYSWRGLFHDFSKPFMYMFPWLNEDEIQRRHRSRTPHHVESEMFCSIPHLVEMYIDWECAFLTKPDKPLNAFGTLIHFYPEYIRYMLPVCLALNVKSVSSDVWLHSWHELYKDENKNAKVFGDVLDVLKRISNTYFSQEWALKVKKQYDLGKSITQFNPEEIFMLTILWHSEKMNFEIDYNLVDGVVDQVYNEMKTHSSFTHSETSKVLLHTSEIKQSTYRA
ncbi:MAG: hypothetical protein IJX20_05010 [Alphaproteobacteria bacterium]|nr:hypothetical protein [Alphaproteobacteria bacterium]